jgi:hypothetical protein
MTDEKTLSSLNLPEISLIWLFFFMSAIACRN